MKKLFIFICLGLLSLNMLAQPKSNKNESTLLVMGVAELEEIPENVMATIKVKVEATKYSECHKKIWIEMEKTKSIFINKGIKNELLKTSSIKVSEKYDRVESSLVHTGYEGSISISIESKYTEEFANKLMAALEDETIALKYDIRFELSESQKAELRKKTIAIAIQDAKEKADVIAKSSGLKLMKIKSIIFDNGSWYHRDNDLVRTDIAFGMVGSIAGMNHGRKRSAIVNPVEIGIRKSVEFTWIVKEK